jgi:hypothetical protein
LKKIKTTQNTAEQLKNIFSYAFLGDFAERMGKISPGFNPETFLKTGTVRRSVANCLNDI